MYQVITKEIHIFALPNQIQRKSFTGMMKEKSCIFSHFSALQGCDTMEGKNRESSDRQAIRRTEAGPSPSLTKPWRSTSWTFC